MVWSPGLCVVFPANTARAIRRPNRNGLNHGTRSWKTRAGLTYFMVFSVCHKLGPLRWPQPTRITRPRQQSETSDPLSFSISPDANPFAQPVGLSLFLLSLLSLPFYLPLSGIDTF